jgi:hypothetical protein
VWLLFAFFGRHEKDNFTLQFFPKKTTRLLSPLEPVGSGDVAKQLGGHRAALGDEHVGVGVEVVERVNTVEGGAEGKGGEDGDAAGFDGVDDGRLVGSREVGVDDTEATNGRHSGGHGTLVDGVHRGGRGPGEEPSAWRGRQRRDLLSYRASLHLFFYFVFSRSGVMGVSVGLVTI